MQALKRSGLKTNLIRWHTYINLGKAHKHSQWKCQPRAHKEQSVNMKNIIDAVRQHSDPQLQFVTIIHVVS